MKKTCNNARGITLVALAVTVVILLILSGVSLNLVLGNSGIITKAVDARDETKRAKENETKDLSSLDATIEEMAGTIPSNEATKPYLPTGCNLLMGSNLNYGLIMQDKKENQYVWVEVPRTNEVYQTAGISITDFTDEAYLKIEDDLHSYTTTYRKGTTYSDTWHSKDQIGLEEDEYNNIKKKMLKSVYQNGGFWVGRYEVGDSTSTTNNTARIGETGITNEAVIKEGQHPYDFVTCNEAETIAKRFNPDSSKYNSNLLFGVQWDLILKYLETKGVSQADLKDDSTTWGNYSNAKYDITKGKYNEANTSDWTLTTWNLVNNKFTKMDNSYVILTTGASDRNSKQGIYDLAGNVWEWTIEYTSYSDELCALRGGSSYRDGIGFNATNRGSDNSSGKFSDTGFRVSIY